MTEPSQQQQQSPSRPDPLAQALTLATHAAHLAVVVHQWALAPEDDDETEQADLILIFERVERALDELGRNIFKPEEDTDGRAGPDERP